MSEVSRPPLSTDRLKAFVDGVMAIVITILVVTIEVPEADLGAGEWRHFLVELERQLHPYVGSFGLVAAYWVQHAVILHYAPYSDRRFIWLNILLLLPLTLMPFLTQLRVDYPTDAVPAALYGLCQVLCGLLLLAIWSYATGPHGFRTSNNRLFGDRKEFVYYNPGARRIAEKASAPVKGRSHTIETTVELSGKEEGVLVACGGFTGGYTLYIKNNKVFYDYNYYNGLYYTLESPKLPKGEVSINFNFIETGGSKARIPGGRGELYINGKKVDEVDMPEMHISTFSLSETFDVGIDSGTPVSDKYRVKNHYPYSGDLDKVVVRLTDS